MSALACTYCGDRPTYNSKYCAVCGTICDASVLPFPLLDAKGAELPVNVPGTQFSAQPTTAERIGRGAGQAVRIVWEEFKSASRIKRLFAIVFVLIWLFVLWQKLLNSGANTSTLPSAPAPSTIELPKAKSTEASSSEFQATPISRAEKPKYNGGVSQADAIAFARNWFEAGSITASVDDILPFYSPEVDYYKKGVVNQEFIAADKAGFIKRWPVRRYVIEDITHLGIGVAGESLLSISFKWEVENATQSKSGSASIELSVKDFEGRLLIIKESGG